jgi:hypothetical protein
VKEWSLGLWTLRRSCTRPETVPKVPSIGPELDTLRCVLHLLKLFGCIAVFQRAGWRALADKVVELSKARNCPEGSKHRS